MRNAALLMAIGMLAAACGGSSANAPPPEPAPQRPSLTDEQPAANPHANSIWYVYWEGIHCLTVYPSAGAIRSEEPHNANATFSSRSPHFSIVSVYFEREDDWAPVIAAAASLQDLLERLAAIDQVEIQEAPNPVREVHY